MHHEAIPDYTSLAIRLLGYYQQRNGNNVALDHDLVQEVALCRLLGYNTLLIAESTKWSAIATQLSQCYRYCLLVRIDSRYGQSRWTRLHYGTA